MLMNTLSVGRMGLSMEKLYKHKDFFVPDCKNVIAVLEQCFSILFGSIQKGKVTRFSVCDVVMNGVGNLCKMLDFKAKAMFAV